MFEDNKINNIRMSVWVWWFCFAAYCINLELHSHLFIIGPLSIPISIITQYHSI